MERHILTCFKVRFRVPRAALALCLTKVAGRADKQTVALAYGLSTAFTRPQGFGALEDTRISLMSQALRGSIKRSRGNSDKKDRKS